ncbi:HAD superfamily phosphatase (TIGR01681 family)/FkbH-like protein [Micromonospora pisi]|uniref:HAD superfamily phosphatase (TIGR01681 family)/FkbH-like protein n=1 Tax=Micromonospora pisi TaxID=589240 RepID=A0A495JTD5_9ACTN|nr:HAD-IIIC family phosphatase [Micromonospora pisi]RKR92256.1 HAD superfamily phosphatase (TIGR01681 family)/FkbH-like protein [Micromonospora pisi]
MLTVRVAASFTAEPLAEVLRFWAGELALPMAIEFAPYGQVFQQLLDPGSPLRTGRDGVNVVAVRPTDIADPDGFVAALRTADQRAAAPLVLALCPDPPTAGRSTTDTERVVRDGLTGGTRLRLRLIGPAELADRYPVAEPHDAYADRLGRVPYTPEFFAALGTALARTVHALVTTRPKVIVVDADNTLWNGIVGEDGPGGVTVDRHRRAIQQLLVAQRDTGRLLCLCSRNQPADVDAVLTGHPDLPLRPEHLTASRVNWQPKSENLRSLAAELNLGLESFVFLDDSPVEVAEVRAACPEVLALTLPSDSAAAAAFLRHCWPLDLDRVTDEDRERAARYEQEARRHAWRERGMLLADFHAGLELRVDIAPARPDQRERVAQLAQRTNQFNLAPVRRDPLEPAAPDLDCLVVTVEDRFGDYGLVGVVGYTVDAELLRVDTFLLSCRALGRGVEHRMLAHLGDLALERGLSTVALACLPTARNGPARTFLAEVTAGTPAEPQPGQADPVRYHRLPASVAAAVRHRPDATSEPPGRDAIGEPPGSDVEPVLPGPAAPWAMVERIATTLAEPAAVRAALLAANAPSAGTAGGDPVSWADGVDPVEARVMAIWAELLAVAPRTPSDNFFALGGQSLQLVQFMARVREMFAVELPVELLFTPAFTVAEVSREIRERQLAGVDGAELTGLIAELERLSDAEIESLLAEEGA